MSGDKDGLGLTNTSNKFTNFSILQLLDTKNSKGSKTKLRNKSREELYSTGFKDARRLFETLKDEDHKEN